MSQEVDERLREEQTGSEYSDVLIIGAGISGIGAAYRIHQKNPRLPYTVLERRERIGGTVIRVYGPTATSSR